MPNQNLQKNTPHAATNMQSPLSLKPAWGVMLPNQAWNYVRKAWDAQSVILAWVKGTFLLKSWQGSSTINITNIRVQERLGAFDYMIEFNGNPEILKTVKSAELGMEYEILLFQTSWNN